MKDAQAIIYDCRRLIECVGEDMYIKIGKKLYGICDKCGKWVRINKLIFGGLHLCALEDEMPFKLEDVGKHNARAAADPAKARQWVETANAILRDCEAEGGSDCDGKAIRIANSKV